MSIASLGRKWSARFTSLNRPTFVLNYQTVKATPIQSGKSSTDAYAKKCPNRYNWRPYGQSKQIQFYISVGKTIAEKAQTLTEKLGFTALDNKSQSNKDMSEYSSNQEFYFRPVTEQEILEIVKALPSNKAPGEDKVTVRILKFSLPVTLPRLTNLIKCSFRSGIFAEPWKMAEVVPCI